MFDFLSGISQQVDLLRLMLVKSKEMRNFLSHIFEEKIFQTIKKIKILNSQGDKITSILTLKNSGIQF